MQLEGTVLFGLFVAPVRLWAIARRALCEAWEAKNDRAYWGAAKGKAPLDPVWRWAVKSEAEASNQHVASALLDIAAFYEGLDWQVLYQEAAAVGFPTSVVRAAIAIYGAPRYVRLGPFSSEGAVRPQMRCGWLLSGYHPHQY